MALRAASRREASFFSSAAGRIARCQRICCNVQGYAAQSGALKQRIQICGRVNRYEATSADMLQLGGILPQIF
jgi:hypothetical protein